MQPSMDYYALRAALEWQVELGVDEAISETPINRYEEPAAKPKLKIGAKSNIAPIDVVPNIIPEQAAESVATVLAAKCQDLNALRDALNIFDLCALKKGARNTIFADGSPDARVMVIGDAPSKEEDKEGTPFVGSTGQLLGRMFDAIDLSRTSVGADSLYITNVLPWRPPQGRDPSLEEITMMLPFLKRHIELVNPDFIVVMGNMACSAILGKTGITRLRGKWETAFDKAVLPMFHPAFLLRDPSRKKDAWADLLSLKAKLL